jgi:hypothetical protein
MDNLQAQEWQRLNPPENIVRNNAFEHYENAKKVLKSIEQENERISDELLDDASNFLEKANSLKFLNVDKKYELLNLIDEIKNQYEVKIDEIKEEIQLINERWNFE